MAALRGNSLSLAERWPPAQRRERDPDVAVTRPDSIRTLLHRSNLAEVEDWCVSPNTVLRPSFECACHLVLTYRGLCRSSFGNPGAIVDANHTLLVPAGWSALEVGGECDAGFAAVLIRPSRVLIDEIARHSGFAGDFVLSGQLMQSSMRLRLLIQQLLRLCPWLEPLQRDEYVVEAIAEAFGSRPRRPCKGASKAVERAKALLHARAEERLNLDEIAAEAGVTPVYLTQEFTRREGIPLYRYQMQLRLTRALLELPDCEDITALALDLGFSSHSHFTCAFRKAFGTTPSATRRALLHRRPVERARGCPGSG